MNGHPSPMHLWPASSETTEFHGIRKATEQTHGVRDPMVEAHLSMHPMEKHEQNGSASWEWARVYNDRLAVLPPAGLSAARERHHCALTQSRIYPDELRGSRQFLGERGTEPRQHHSTNCLLKAVDSIVYFCTASLVSS
jgi:hypothetical protein